MPVLSPSRLSAAKTTPRLASNNPLQVFLLDCLMLPGGQTPDKQNDEEEKKTNKCNMCEYTISQEPSEATLENTHWRKVKQM